MTWPKMWKGEGDHEVKYAKLRNKPANPNAKPQSRIRYVRNKAAEVLGILQSVNAEQYMEILKELAKKLGLLVISRESLQLTPSQCIVIRDYVGTSTNGLYRLKQALEALIPELRGDLMPACIHRKVAVVEGQGVIPACVVEVNVLLTKKGNKHGMRPYTYIQNPMQLFL